MSVDESELWSRAEEIARKLLSAEISLEEGTEELSRLYIEFDLPEDLKDWFYLHDGHSSEYYDQTWIPGVTKYNHEKWIETVRAKAQMLLNKRT